VREYRIIIEGTSPLLQHRYIFKDELAASTTKKSGSTDYSEEWKKACYWDKEVGLYQPATHIEGALIKAAANFQITGRSKKTYKDLVKSAVFAQPEYIPFGFGKKSPDDLLAKGLIQIHKAAVVVQRNRVERLRPMLPAEWKLTFTLQVLDDQLPKDALKEILDYAGRFVGIGDWRPRYGRFLVSKFV